MDANELLEKVAQRLCELDEREWSDLPEQMRDDYRKLACAAIRLIVEECAKEVTEFAKIVKETELPGIPDNVYGSVQLAFKHSAERIRSLIPSSPEASELQDASHTDGK